MDQNAWERQPFRGQGLPSLSEAVAESTRGMRGTPGIEGIPADAGTVEPGDGDERLRSLTSRLARTAVGVREMSKQLGRARVQSSAESVLIITKARDNTLIRHTRELCLWLMSQRRGSRPGLIVYVDSQLRNSPRFNVRGIREEHPEFFEPVRTRRNEAGEGEGLLRFWTNEMCSASPHLFDFVITLGGDGTVLYCSWLFQRSVPPVVPFSLGSFGFLTNFEFGKYKKALTALFEHGMRLNMRMRFTATVYRAISPSDPGASWYKERAIRSGETGEIIMRNVMEHGWRAIEVASAGRDTASEAPPSNVRSHRDKPVHCFGTRPVETFEVLNDLVVDRGPSPFVSQLEVFADNIHLTTAQADGLCIATPTGSTAYSLSAGGSLVHPEIPSILITPICPHTLSFRPMLLPDSMELRIAVPYNSRSNAWASFDGRGRIEIRRGDHIKVNASPFPFPTVCPDDQPSPWFDSVSRTLKWNERQRQKSFVVVEEDVSDAPRARHAHRHDRTSEAEQDGADDGAEEQSDDDQYDILDDSQAGSRAEPSDPTVPLDVRSRRAPVLGAGATLCPMSSIQPSGTAQQPQNHQQQDQQEQQGQQGQQGQPEQPEQHQITGESPDRFGSAGPPHPPHPLSERHLAAVDFRLQQDAQQQAQTHEHTKRPNQSCAEHGQSPATNAFVVYGNDDSDDSE